MVEDPNSLARWRQKVDEQFDRFDSENTRAHQMLQTQLERIDSFIEKVSDTTIVLARQGERLNNYLEAQRYLGSRIEKLETQLNALVIRFESQSTAITIWQKGLYAVLGVVTAILVGWAMETLRH